MTEVIDIRDLWFSYNGQPVLRDVNLTVQPGELVCMVGPNGGGKTTLLKLILGLLKPGRGTIRILGSRPAEARSRVGYAPQHASFDAGFPASVMDVVRMGRLGADRSADGRSDKELAVQAMRDVGIEPLAKRTLGELSGGQLQRVTIARSLVCEPKLLLLDEPTASLDVGVEMEFYQLLGNLRERMTIVVVSHDIGFVTGLVGKAVCVQGTVAVHPTAELTGELMRELYGQDIRLVRHDHDCLTQCVTPRNAEGA